MASMLASDPERNWFRITKASLISSTRRKEIAYILEVVRGRFSFEKKKVMELKRRYNCSTLLIEGSPISLGLIQSLREQSINVTAYKPDTDKRARLIAQTDLFAGGSVRLPRRAGWLEEFVAELLSFPPRRPGRCSHPRPRLGSPTVESKGDSQPSPWGLLAPVCLGGQFLYDRSQAIGRASPRIRPSDRTSPSIGWGIVQRQNSGL